MKARLSAGAFVACLVVGAPSTAQTDPTIVFERGYSLVPVSLPILASTIDCNLNLTESIGGTLREDERIRLRSTVSFRATSDGAGLSVTFTGLGTDHPMLVGNAGSSELFELETGAMVRTLVEHNATGFPFIYNIDYETGMIIATKAYMDAFGGYGHVAAGACRVRR